MFPVTIQTGMSTTSLMSITNQPLPSTSLFSGRTVPMTTPSSPTSQTSPEPSPSVETETSLWAARGLKAIRRWCGWLTSTLLALVPTRKLRAVFDPINVASGSNGCQGNTEYVSRWALVEFGVSCPRCGGLAAQKGQFSKIIKTTSGEAVQCADSTCRWLLFASPDTEHEDHKLPFDAKAMYRFSRERHPMSPYSSQEAHVIRQSKPGFMEALTQGDPKLLDQIKKEQDGAVVVTTSQDNKS